MSYESEIGLRKAWPTSKSVETVEAMSGYARFAASYMKAATAIYSLDGCTYPTLIFAGPVMQMTGLATELTFKSMLRGAGSSEKTLRKYSHNIVGAFEQVSQLIDKSAFQRLVWANTKHLTTPTEVVERYVEPGSPSPHLSWRFFEGQLHILDEVYDKPYRSRYFQAGPVVLPEPYIILVGVKILLNAMSERLDIDLLPYSE